jgi:SAM-dependent methyltransferase
MSFDNEGIRVEEAKACLLCGQPGPVLYQGLRDRLFGSLGVWGLRQCAACGLLWLDPRPLHEDIGKVYADYYTHGQGAPPTPPSPPKVPRREKAKHSVLAAQYGYLNPHASLFWSSVGKVGRLLPLLRDVAGGFVRDFPWVPGGALLEVGCGDGRFLANMRGRGWRVMGIEPDPAAARVARERYGVEVAVGALEDAALPAASVDAIALTHVLEHVHEPMALLQECGRVLKPAGRLVVETPNAQSWSHRLFGSAWRGLEPPRHLFLFSPASLHACAQKAGLQIVSVRTTNRSGRMMYKASHALRHQMRHPQVSYRPGRRVAFNSWVFLAAEEARRLCDGKAGDTLLLIATRA